MKRLFNKITFTSKTDSAVIVLDFVNEIQIESSFENKTDTAKITIPKTITNNGKPISTGSDSIFKRGDKVKIECGYYPNLTTIFEGYITTVNTKSPIIIECEDEMFLLKNSKVIYPKKRTVVNSVTSKKGKVKMLKKPRVYSSAINLSDLLNEFHAVMWEEHEYELDYQIFSDPDLKTTTNDVNLGSFRATNVSVVECLDVLKKEYGIYSYFRNGVLKVGFPSDASDTKTIPLVFEENIIDDTNIEFQRKEDLRLRIKAISMNSNNTKLEEEVGDADGTLKTFHYYNATQSDLIAFANLKLKTFQYTGFVGDITTFGEPFIRHGDAVKLKSYKYPDKDGTYQVKGVKRGFGMNGYRQVLELGVKLA